MKQKKFTIATKIFMLLVTAAPAFAKENLAHQVSFSETDVSDLSVELTAENLIIENSVNQEITVEVYTNNSKKIPDIECKNHVLKIFGKKRVSFKIGEYCKVYIYVPKGKKFNNAKISSSSGDIQSDFLNAESAFISASSGNISLDSINSKKSEFSASSGDVKIGTLNSDSFNATTSSGNIGVNSAKSQEAVLQTTSGNLKIDLFECESFSAKATSGNISAKSLKSDFFKIQVTSGDVDVGLKSIPMASSSINASSGDISLFVPKDEPFSVKTSSSSGTFRDRIKNNKVNSRDFFTSDYNNGGVQILLSTTSGDIELW